MIGVFNNPIPASLSYLLNDKFTYTRKSIYTNVSDGTHIITNDAFINDTVYKIAVITNFENTTPFKVIINNAIILYCQNGISISDADYIKSSNNTVIVFEGIENPPSDASITVILYCKPNS